MSVLFSLIVTDLEVIKKSTENVEEIHTDSVEVAKQNVLTKIGIKEEEESAIANINGIKIATLPVTGTISYSF